MPLIPYAGKDEFDRGWSRPTPARKPSRRNLAILRRHAAGDSHVQIAADYGIGRERVRQIIEKLDGTPRRGRQRKN